jgi:hypothetical protein
MYSDDDDKRTYSITKCFRDNLYERTGSQPTEDNLAYILSVCNTQVPHKKIDDKGRPSAYFTFTLNGTLVTVVCDYQTKKVITCIKETHHRKRFTER